MPLEEIVDSLEKVDEGYQDLYVKQDDGKFKIDISGLKSALAKETNKRKLLKKELGNKKAVDDDPNLDEMAKELKSAKKTINNMKINGKIKTSAISAGIDPNYIDDVVVLTRSNFDIDEDGDIVNIDADGTPSGKSVETFFKSDFKTKRPRYFVSSGKKGSGSFDTDGVTPLSFDGKMNKAIKNKDISELIRLKQSKINNK